jgi:hypothetical protein
MNNDVQPLSEDAKQRLREQDPDWAYNMCCGRCLNGCYVDALTGA